MFSALQVFETREPLVPEYSAPNLRALSDDLFDVPLDLPAKPVIVSVVVGQLKWRASAGALAYQVERKTGALWQGLGVVSELTMTDAGIIAPGYYRVKALNGAGFSEPSNILFLEE